MKADMKTPAPAHKQNHTAAPIKAGFAELFLEVGCEEIPAGMIANAAHEFQVVLNKYLALEKLAETHFLESTR